MLALAPSGCRAPAPQAPPLRPSAPALSTPLPAAPVANAPEPEPEVALAAPGPGLVVRGQPWLRGVRAWDGGLIALGDARDGAGGSYRLEPIDRPERTRAVPLVVPGTKRVVDVAMEGDTAAALVVTGDGLALAFHRGASWSIEPVPEPARAPAEVFFAAAPGAVVLLCPGRLHVLGAGGWKSVPVGPLPETGRLASPSASRHVLLTADRLFLGFGAGEWGGALASLDLATGVWKTYPEFDDPVRDLGAGPDGTPWVAVGLSHLGGVKGTLSRLDGSRWKAVARIHGFSMFRETTTRARLAWDLPLASFDALAFDASDRLHLLSGELGVARRDGARWTRLTPAWPEHVYVSGLAVRGDLLVIATFDAGVLLWDAGTGRARRVALAGDDARPAP